jgi:hypothetical protein
MGHDYNCIRLSVMFKSQNSTRRIIATDSMHVQNTFCRCPLELSVEAIRVVLLARDARAWNSALLATTVEF